MAVCGGLGFFWEVFGDEVFGDIYIYIKTFFSAILLFPMLQHLQLNH